jgi:phenylalanyl-tRNA synthetase alpha chain
VAAVSRARERSLLLVFTMKAQTAQSLDQLGVRFPEDLARLFSELRAEFDGQAGVMRDEASWTALRDAWLGRKAGMLAAITANWLKPAPVELKSAVGVAFNALRTHVDTVLAERHRAIQAAAEQTALAREHLDLSLPGVMRPVGTRHLIRQTFSEVERIFLSLGYQVAEGPEIESPYYNFEALNIPEFHPARDNMDTFYMETHAGQTTRLLRTHTSPMQIRTMEKRKPPVRIIVPGKVYRRDNPDATHSFMFHQVEGLAVDTDLTFRDFKGTIEYFIREFFGPSTKTRFRSSFFPFTEPSVEFDASCIFCNGRGTGCPKCKGSGWIELFGAGMVDPAVYGFVNYDAANLSGFAFGIGIDRLAMLKHGIGDIQMFFQNDVRFLRQFP